MVRKLLKRVPMIRNAYSSVRKIIERLRIEKANKRYRKIIAPLLDEYYLNEKIEALDQISLKGNKTYYIIAQQNTKVGIFGYINCFLPHIAYAVAKGYIPVIDMQSYNSIYIPESEYGSVNAWELFFEQPMNVGLEDISDGKVIRCPDTLWYRWMPNSCPMMSDDEIKMWATLYAKYIRYTAKAKRYIEAEQNEILRNRNGTVGVIYRGTTYTKGQAVGHPIQPSMKMLADAVEKMMHEHNAEFIYLASDEKSIVTYMNKRFPGKVLINKRVYYDEVEDIDYSKYNVDGTDIIGTLFARPNNEYLIGIEYISSMNLVANCSFLVAGACGGCTAVLYMNGLKYRKRYVFDLGKYGSSPIPTDEE